MDGLSALGPYHISPSLHFSIPPMDPGLETVYIKVLEVCKGQKRFCPRLGAEALKMYGVEEPGAVSCV